MAGSSRRGPVRPPSRRQALTISGGEPHRKVGLATWPASRDPDRAVPVRRSRHRAIETSCHRNIMPHARNADQRRTNAPIATTQQTVDIDNRTKAPFALFASQGAPTSIISLHQRLPLCDENVLFRDEPQEYFVRKTNMTRDCLVMPDTVPADPGAHHDGERGDPAALAECGGRRIAAAIAARAGISGPPRHR